MTEESGSQPGSVSHFNVPIQILKNDYAHFPHNQTYSIYAEDLYFKDPMSQFRGVKIFRTMLTVMEKVFLNCVMDLHDIRLEGNIIRTEWTLSWNTPLPWKPRIAVPGWSELTLNEEGLIISQIDYWCCSRFDVLKQHFQTNDKEQ